MTPGDVCEEVAERSGITPVVQVSCGVERCEDLLNDFRQGLDPEGAKLVR